MEGFETVGKITKTFGLDGGVVITVYDSFPEQINTKEPLYAVVDGLAVPLYIAGFQRRGQRGAVVRFEDVDSEKRAEQILGSELMIKLPGNISESMDDELYFDDLIGFRATIKKISEADDSLTKIGEGSIQEFMDDEYNPLFIVDVDGEEVFIPANDNFIDSLDTDTREISFILPEGLIDLNASE